MKLAKVANVVGSTKAVTNAWKGLSLREGATGGSLIWGAGLTSDEYPALRTHNGDVKNVSFFEPAGLFAWDELVIADNSRLYYGDTELTTVNDEEKQFAVVGTKLIVWPDKIMVDLVNQETTKMDATYTTATPATFTKTTIQAEPVPAVEEEEDRYRMTATTPFIRKYDTLDFADGVWSGTGEEDILLMNLEPGDLFICYETDSGSFQPNVNWVVDDYEIGHTYRYPNNTKGMYGEVTDITNNDWYMTANGCYGTYYFDYTRRNITVENLPWSGVFSVGDSVSITGCETYEDNNKEILEITDINDDTNTLTFSANTFSGTGSSWQDGPITVTRSIPPLDFICEKDNRLWGVANASVGKVWNEGTEEYDEVSARVIYSSALGDPMQFYDYNGISTDSYAVAVGSANDFTGIVNYNGSILCFKEDLVHRITGDYPANYYMYTDIIEGVASDATKSMVVVNEVLYYKGRAGVYAYTGGQPDLISYPLGPDKLHGGVGGTDGINYYLSAHLEEDSPMLLCYDGVHGVWMHHGAVDARFFARLRGKVYFSTDDGVYEFEAGDKSGEAWELLLAPYDEDSYANKQYLRLAVTLRLEGEANATFYVSFDGEEPAELFSVSNSTGVSQKYPIKYLPIRRAHRMQISAVGEGDVTLRAIEREFIGCSEEG